MSVNKSFEKHKDDEAEYLAGRPKSVEEVVGSHYALQVALQTMKERCQNLQQRLGTVEEENVCLRLESLKLQAKLNSENSSANEEPKKATEQLEEKVAQLTRQKSQLTHHLFMVASENRQLWNRLSRLTQANQSLGNHLTKISNTLSRHSSSSNLGLGRPHSPTNSILPNKKESPQHTPSSSMFTLKDSGEFNKRSSLAASNDGKQDPLSKVQDESLEEISLKLIKSFLQEKTELEDQYSQMVEMQAGASSSFNMHTLGFGYLEEEEITALEEMKNHHQSLVELRDLAQQQQQGIKSAIENMEKLKKDGVLCPQCQKREKNKNSGITDEEIEHEMESLRQWGIPEGTSYTEDIRRQLDQVAEPPTVTPSAVLPPLPPAPKVEDRMCPLCGKFYSKSESFKDFQKHVMNHFPEDDNGEDSSLSLINNFEVISQDI